MNSRKRFWSLVVALPLAASAVLAATLTVVVQETQVRQRPQFFAPAVATVRLGDRISGSDASSGGWFKVKTGDASGYIHESAVTAKKVKLASRSAGDSGTSAEEITLAGKGFNEQVEKSYKAGHGDLDFKKVDAMEKRKVGDSKLAAFMKSGGLLPPGQGGAQ